MLSFENFCTHLKDNILKRLPDTFRNAEVVVHKVTNATRVYTGLAVVPDGNAAAPVLPLEPLYDLYTHGTSFDQILVMAAFWVKQKIDMAKSVPAFSVDKYENVKPKLFLRVLNTKLSAEILKVSPHRLYGDIALACYILLRNDSAGMMSTIVTNDLCEAWGKMPGQVFTDAMKNAPKILPILYAPISKFTGMPSLSNMHVVTTTTKTDGAAALFYPGVMEQMSELMGGNYYVIPSSINEVMLFQDLGADAAKDLDKMIFDSNRSEILVKPEDVLSDRLYYYDAEKKWFGIAADRK